MRSYYRLLCFLSSLCQSLLIPSPLLFLLNLTIAAAFCRILSSSSSCTTASLSLLLRHLLSADPSTSHNSNIYPNPNRNCLLLLFFLALLPCLCFITSYSSSIRRTTTHTTTHPPIRSAVHYRRHQHVHRSGRAPIYGDSVANQQQQQRLQTVAGSADAPYEYRADVRAPWEVRQVGQFYGYSGAFSRDKYQLPTVAVLADNDIDSREAQLQARWVVVEDRASGVDGEFVASEGQSCRTTTSDAVAAHSDLNIHYPIIDSSLPTSASYCNPLSLSATAVAHGDVDIAAAGNERSISSPSSCERAMINIRPRPRIDIENLPEVCECGEGVNVVDQANFCITQEEPAAAEAAAGGGPDSETPLQLTGAAESGGGGGGRTRQRRRGGGGSRRMVACTLIRSYSFPSTRSKRESPSWYRRTQQRWVRDQLQMGSSFGMHSAACTPRRIMMNNNDSCSTTPRRPPKIQGPCTPKGVGNSSTTHPQKKQQLELLMVASSSSPTTPVTQRKQLLQLAIHGGGTSTAAAQSAACMDNMSHEEQDQHFSKFIESTKARMNAEDR